MTNNIIELVVLTLFCACIILWSAILMPTF